METRRNWFTYIYLTFFGIFVCYSLFGGILNIGVSTKYPFLWYGGILLAMGGLWLISNSAAIILSHFDIYRFRLRSRIPGTIAEAVIIAAVILAAGAIRIWIIRYLPVQPQSDFQTYYNVADLLAKGTLKRDGAGYCDYISQFPHVIGYPYILSLIFKMFGASVTTGLHFNLAVSLLSVFFVNRIARLVCGRAAGVLAMVLAAFWPSQVLFINQMASEPLFTCLSLLCIWITAYLFSPSSSDRDIRIFVLNILLGIMLAVAGGVRPVSVVLLIAIIVCTITYKAGNAEASNTKAGLIKTCMARGWIRAIFLLAGFLICSQLISGATARAIDRKLPGTTVSFGYNLMVGLNVEAKGAWNEQDAKFLNDRFIETGSAVEAHKASLEQALKRINEDPEGIANLLFQKYALLWANDDYGSYWNLLFMEQQHNLTPERKEFINSVAIWNNIYYIICVYMSLIAGIFLWFRKKAGTVHILVLYFVGIAFLHMVVESQSRYHYSILPVFAILAAVGAAEIFRFHRHWEEQSCGSQSEAAGLEHENRLIGEQLSKKQEHGIEESKAPVFTGKDKNTAAGNRFDMLDAIQKGHVTVTVTEAYLKEKEEKLKEDNKE